MGCIRAEKNEVKNLFLYIMYLQEECRDMIISVRKENSNLINKNNILIELIN